MLEDWLLSIRSSGLAAGTRTSRVSAVRLFLEEQWEDGLARMPRSATIHAGEIPSDDCRLPRGIEAPVFDQVIDPGNLGLLSSEQHRTIIRLLAFTGLRISSIVTLARDALEIGTDGHPYLDAALALWRYTRDSTHWVTAAIRSLRQRANRRSVAAIVLMVYAARVPRRE